MGYIERPVYKKETLKQKKNLDMHIPIWQMRKPRLQEYK
jgi:hypothetical protein